MTSKQDAIRAVYAQVHAPAWAAPNLDGLLDVLRDLSWLPEGPVTVASDDPSVRAVVRQAEADTADGPRPVRLA